MKELSTKFFSIAGGGKLVLMLMLFFTCFSIVKAQNPLASAQDFNVFTEGNLSITAGDIEGSIAVGGNLFVLGNSQRTSANATGGTAYTTIGGVKYALVVGGGLSGVNGGNVFKVDGKGTATDDHFVRFNSLSGSSAASGSGGIDIGNPVTNNLYRYIRVNNTVQASTSVQNTTALVSFATAFTDLRAQATTLSNCAGNVTPSVNGGQATLNLGANTTNVWNVSGATLNSYSQINLSGNLPTATRPLVINVNASGTFNWNNLKFIMGGESDNFMEINRAPYIIWNFYNATILNITTAQLVLGSILAPNAAVTNQSSGNITGQLIAKSFTKPNAGELHIAKFNANTTCATTSSCTCPGNLVLNPSFESGTANWGWSGGTLSAGNGAAVCGTYSGDFQISNTASNWVSQTIGTDLPIGTVINASVYAGTHNNSYYHEVIIAFFDANWNWISNSAVEVNKVLGNAPVGPQFYSWSGVVPAGTKYTQVGFSGNGDWIKTDQWCVTTSAPTTVSLGNQLFVDVNGNGVKDGSDWGLDGYVTVKLYADNNDDGVADGAAVASTTTSGGGFYNFSGLAQGKYFVQLEGVPTWMFKTPINGGDPDNNIDNDNNATIQNTSTGIIKGGTIELTLGAEPQTNYNPTYDFGVYKNNGLGDYVFLDANSNGIQDAGENGIQNVTVRLKNTAGTVLATTTTDATGYYYFYDPAQYGTNTYNIEFVTPAGYSPSPSNQGTDDTKDSDPVGGVISNVNVPIGTWNYSLDAGFVTNNCNCPGGTNLVLNPSFESGTTNWSWSGGTLSQGTGGVACGAYSGDLNNTTTNSWAWQNIATNPAPGTVFNASVYAGTHDNSFNNLVGIEFYDVNGNRLSQSVFVQVDKILGNSPVGPQLYNITATAPTGTSYVRASFFGNGSYTKTDQWCVTATVPPCTAKVTSLYFNKLDGGSDLPITNGAVFTPAQLGSLYNFEAGTTGTVGSVRFTITGPTPSTNIENAAPYNSPATGGGAWTGAEGTYFVNLKTYSNPDGTGTLCHDTTISFILTSATGSIGDRVWYDADGDGIQDASETGGITGVTVQLRNSAGTVIATTNTNASGNYLFSGLAAGNYTVVFPVSISGAVVTTQNVGADDNVDSDASQTTGITPTIVLGVGQNITNVDAGYCPTTLVIGNYVWEDRDNDGVQDAGEPGINLATVRLYVDNNNDNVPDGASIATTTTNTSGNYTFANLAPGNYIVGVVIPSGYTVAATTTTSADPNNDNNTDNNGVTTISGEVRSNRITLVAGTEPSTDGDGTDGNLTLDFGLIGTGSIGDFVFVDVNGNGIQDGGLELGIPNTTVTLGLPDGSTKVTNTDANGLYSFTNLAPGTYSVTFVTPAGYTPTTSNVGGDDTKDSDPIAGVVTGIAVNGNSNTTIDAGFYQLVNLGNHVWYDRNNNGTKEVGEPAIVGATVNLYVDANNDNIADGAAVATTTTIAGGAYAFNNLAPNNYIVGVVIPAGYAIQTINGGDADNNIDNDNNGITVVAGEVRSNAVTLTNAGEPTTDGDGNNGNLTVDFGFKGTGAIGNFVWNDANGNGIQDGSELGIGGVTVTLTYPDGTTATTITDVNGGYSFTNLAPTGAGQSYSVTFGTPAGYTPTVSNVAGSTEANDSDPIAGIVSGITLSAGQVNNDVDAGFYLPVALGNFVWDDKNNNGIQDAGEPGINGATVNLYRDANGDNIPDGAAIGTATTSGGGLYGFGSLTPGNYIVGVVIPAGYVASSTTATSASPNNDNLTDNNGVTTVSSEIRSNFITLVSGAEPTNDGDGNNANQTLDFGLRSVASLGDKVWRDDNKDGVQDAGEPGVAGITVSLFDNTNKLVGSTVTDAYGNYLFSNLPAGDYTVSVTLPANYTFTSSTGTSETDAANSDVNAITGNTTTITLSAGENQLNIDAGIIFNTTPPVANIGDRVWLDTDKDGIQDAGEPGVSGVTVTLYDNTGAIVATAITDANGNYLFTNVTPGTGYTIGFTAPAGTVFSPKDATTDSNDSDADPITGRTAPFTVVAGVTDLSFDAGLSPQVTTKASLGDKVWNDLNRDGIQDANESGIAGVTVRLLASNGTTVLATTTTDAFGNYTFTNLDAGTYVVEFVKPNGYTSSTKDVGSDDTKDSDADVVTGKTGAIVLAAGDRNTTIDAGMYITTPPGTLLLGDKVWNDENRNGIQDATEDAVSGVTVILYQNGVDGLPNTADDVKLKSTSTDVNGNYLFTDLAASTNAATNYNVQFSNLPSGYSFTTQDQTTGGGNDTNDSDPNTVTGRTGSINLTANNLTVDAGIVQGVGAGKGSLGDRVWYDMPGGTTGVQDAGEQGVSGVTVNLYRDANNDGTISGTELTAIATTTTNALGNYMFGGLDAGNYQVGFSNLPAGFTLTTKDAGTDDTKDSDGNPLGAAMAGNTATAGTSFTGLIALAQGEDNLTIDLGIVPPANTNSLGGDVWKDANNDGNQTPGEQPVKGVMVTLYDAVGTPIATTVTDENGKYLFVGLPDGSYSVGFSNLPAGYNFTNQSATNDAIGSDANVTTGRTTTVTLGAGNRNDTSLDAGLVTTRAALGNYVWFDTNGNGVQDATEAGVSGATVTLTRPGFGADGISGNADDALPVGTSITDATGGYFFGNLAAGNYVVNFATIPNNTVFTQQNTPGDNQNNTNSDANPTNGNTASIALSAGETDLTVDAGVKPTLLGALGNFVWNDVDGDGIQDANEPGVAGVVVTLYNAANQPVGAAITDGNGAYLITNIPAGTGYYAVFSNLPIGGVFTTPNQTAGGGNDTNDSDANTTNGTTGSVTVVAGETNTTVDAGLYTRASIGNYAWYDWNKNGIQDKLEDGVTNELPASNVLVSLFTGAGVFVDSVRTDVNGLYHFNNLAPGDYYLSSQGVTHLPNFALTGINAGTNDSLDSDFERGTYRTITTTLTSGENDNTWDLGVYRDGSGILDPCICKNNATDSTNGQFDELVEVSATPGGVWRIIQQTGMYLLSSPAPPALPVSVPLGTVIPYQGNGLYQYRFVHVDAIGYTVTVTDGQDTLSILNNCYYPNVNLSPFDTTLCLYDAPITLSTNPNMPGAVNYQITRTGDGQVFNTSVLDPKQLGTGSFSLKVTFTPNDPAMCLNTEIFTFNITVTNDCLVNLGNYVWYDKDNDGIQDANELGLPNIPVQLYRDSLGDNIPDGAAIATTTTNGLGFYSFTGLPPGKYIVGVTANTASAGTAPSFTTASSVNPNNDNNADNNGITIVGTEIRSNNVDLQINNEPGVPIDGDSTNSNLTVDFGIKGTGALGNFVWEDRNRNGLQDAGEPGIAGANVTLTYPDGNTATTTTDVNGAYKFENLIPGTYSVAFTTPAGLTPTQSNIGSNDDLDSDPVAGIVNNILITAGEIDNSIDAGFHNICSSTIRGNVWHDADAMDDGVVDNQFPTPVPTIPTGLRATLVDLATGNVVKTSLVTGGTYQFANVLPGSYYVMISSATAPVGQPAPNTILPNGWTYTGEKLGIGTGRDLVINGKLNVSIGYECVNNANFGIRVLNGDGGID